MNENKGELMITVPYDDFVNGVQALQTIIAIRRILKGTGYACKEIEEILCIQEKPESNEEEQGDIKE